MKSGITRAAENKRIRQEALREQLANQKLVEKVIDIANKLADLDLKLEPADVTRLKAAADTKLKLIDKYLPTEKPTTLEGPDGEAIRYQVNLSFGS